MNSKTGILFLIIMVCSLSSPAQTDSLYEFKAHLLDQNNRPAGLDVFRGHPVVMSMFYASCNYTCPMLIGALKKMESKLAPKTRAQTRFLLISFDPDKDTPEVLKKLAVDHKLDLSRWKLVTPTKNEVRDIAALLEFVYRPLESGDFNHTSSLTLVDQTGVPLLHEEGIVNATESIAKRLKEGL